MGARDRWAAAGLTEVTLPSGFKVQLSAYGAVDLATRGIFPSDLILAIAAAEGDQARDAEVMRALADPEAGKALIRGMRIAAADSVRAVWDESAKPPAWEPVTITVEDLDSGTFDPRDVEALIDIVTSKATPREITAATEALGGAIDQAEADRIKREEAAATVIGLTPFRDDDGRDAAGADGGTVPAAAVRPAGNRQSRRRAGARSSAGHAAGAG